MSERDLLRQIMLLDFATFARRALAEVMPGVTLNWNWHLDLICSRLSDLAHGRIKRLLICVPPRSLKSFLCSVVYPAWLMALNESERIMCVSYAQPLADDFGRESRRLIESEFYTSTFDTRLSMDRRAVEQFETTAGGSRIASSVGGTITGRGGRFIILDDPMKPEEAYSDALRNSTLEWVKSTLTSRPNDKLDARILVVMQRLHEYDVAGHYLQSGDFETVILPAIAIEDEEHHYVVGGRPVTYVRKAGEALHPAREPLEILERTRRDMGPLFFEPQYQQNPVPPEGNLVKLRWFPRYESGEVARYDRVIQSWDTGSKTGVSHDYSVCTTWGQANGYTDLIDVWRGKLEMPELVLKVRELSDRFKPQRVLIEDKGAGTGLMQSLRSQHVYNFLGYVPKLDKVSRLASVTPMMANGSVRLSKHSPWLDDYLHELMAFPGGGNDDQVDSTSQGLHWLMDEGAPGAIFEFYREEYEARIAAEQHRTVWLRAKTGVNQIYLKDGSKLNVDVDGTVRVAEGDAGPLLMAGFVRL